MSRRCRSVSRAAAAGGWAGTALLVAAVLAVSAADGAGPGAVRVTVTRWRLPAPVYRTVATVAGGRVYVLGGHDLAGGSITDVYRFDPAHGRVARAGALALQTHGSAAATLNGRVLDFGGASTVVHDTVQWFQPVTGRTVVIGHMPRQRADVTAAVVGNQVVLAGGFDGVGPQSDVWATRDGKHFRVVARLQQAVRYPAVAVHGSDFYVFGGLLSGGEYNGTFTNDIQRIHLPTGTTTIVGHLPLALAHAMGTTVAGQLLVIGGSTPSTTSNAIYRFNPVTKTITRAATLPRPLTDAAIATVGTSTYLLGGVRAGKPLTTIVRINVAGR